MPALNLNTVIIQPGQTTEDSVKGVNEALVANPNTLAVILPPGYHLQEGALEKLVAPIVRSNLLIKATYADVLELGKRYNMVSYAKAYPAAFFNPGVAFLEQNYTSEILEAVNRGHATYYIPETLFICHRP